MGPIQILITVLVGVACLCGGVFVGILYRKRVGEAKIGSAEQRAREVLEEAERQAETLRKEALLSAKEEIIQRQNEMEAELRERRAEISRTEAKLAKKEEQLDRRGEQLDRKSEQIDRKGEQLDRRIRENEALREEIETTLGEQRAALERISGFTAEQARAALVAELEETIRREQAQRIVELETEFNETADNMAQRIMALAIQRCAGDFVAESTISYVVLPSEEMKGRIIGREGRNIQKLETLTGVELIIDDTPEVITISSFDPIRREVARLALERLIADGRIHPARIEEMVEKAKKEVDIAIKQAGERATFEVNIHGINPDLVRLLGRLRYRTSYGQNVLQHSIEVAILAGIMAEELGVDPVLARRAGLLHDIGKAFPYDVEGSHVQIGVNAAKKYKETREVIHAIEAHHGDVEPQTVIAVLVQAADAISAARPGARREDMENYIKRLEKLEEIAESFTGVEKAFAIQAGRELRVMVRPDAVHDNEMPLIARQMAEKIQEEVRYPGQIKINLIRESRVTEIAK